MSTTLLVGVCNFVFIFLKAAQQRNVAFLHYSWVIPTSFAMAVVEVAVISMVAVEANTAGNWHELVPFVIAVGLGGGTGAISSMWIHHRFLTRRPK